MPLRAVPPPPRLLVPILVDCEQCGLHLGTVLKGGDDIAYVHALIALAEPHRARAHPRTSKFTGARVNVHEMRHVAPISLN